MRSRQFPGSNQDRHSNFLGAEYILSLRAAEAAKQSPTPLVTRLNPPVSGGIPAFQKPDCFVAPEPGTGPKAPCNDQYCLLWSRKLYELPGLSLPNDLYQHPLSPSAVELTVEDLLPRAEIEPPLRHRHHHLAAHHLALEVRVAVVFPGAVVLVVRNRLVRRQALQPGQVIRMQAVFIVVIQIYIVSPLL